MARTDERSAGEIVDDFLLGYDTRHRLYVGIDPGAHGAIALLAGPACTVIDMPSVLVKTSKRTKSGELQNRTQYDLGTICAVFALLDSVKHRILVVLERGSARPTDNGVTGFQVGVGFGMWPLFFQSKGYALELVIPSVWKRKLGLLKADKEASRLMAQRLFPTAPLQYKKNEGRAEALLLAHWVRQAHEGSAV